MTISEVSKKYDITTDTLRWYERIGLINGVPRKSSGLRDYDEENCKTIEFIKCMRNAGLSIGFLQKYMELFKKGDSTLLERRQLLMDEREILRKQIKEMKATLERLDFKIENCDKLCDALDNSKNGKNS
jgi:MerR family transcriptional regulator, aldehyde-responsive regulator